VRATVAGQSTRINTKYQSAFTASIKVALIVLFNHDGRSSVLQPENRSDITDKMIWLLSSKATLPDDTEEIARRIKESLPAFAYHLEREYAAPEEIRVPDRFRIKPFKHPILLQNVEDSSTLVHLTDTLQMLVAYHGSALEETTARIYNLLLSYPDTRPPIEKVCKSAAAFGRLLKELANTEGTGSLIKGTAKQAAATKSKI
jgi:hypothetical protein